MAEIPTGTNVENPPQVDPRGQPDTPEAQLARVKQKLDFATATLQSANEQALQSLAQWQAATPTGNWLAYATKGRDRARMLNQIVQRRVEGLNLMISTLNDLVNALNREHQIILTELQELRSFQA